jgi:hypothetical protein
LPQAEVSRGPATIDSNNPELARQRRRDLPAEFERARDAALRKRQAEEEAIREKGRDPNKWGQHSPFDLPADYAFGVPLEVQPR